MKTILTSLLVMVLCGANIAANFYSSLLDVNDRWTYESDFPAEVFDLSEKENPISEHLLLVHQTLSCRSVDHLTPAQRASRTNLLTELKRYARAEEFPANILHSKRQPVFIGPNGNYCAVGHLIRHSGHNDLSVKLSRNMNYHYLLDMKDEELEHWVKQSGFTEEELAWIQPGYPTIRSMASMKGGANGPVHTILSRGNHEVMIAGAFDSAGMQAAGNIAWYYAGFAGFDWTGFGGDGLLGEVYDMVHFNNGIVVAGNFYQADTVTIHSGVAFWDGSKWHNMGHFYVGALVNTVYDLEVYQGELYAAGSFRSNISSNIFSHIARWDGTEWVTLGATPNAMVRTLASYKDKLVLAGEFTSIGNDPFNYIAAYDTINGFQAMDNGLAARVRALETVGDTLYAGGDLYGFAPQDTLGLAYYYNDTWTRVNGFLHTGKQQYVNSLEQTPYGLFVGGELPFYPVVGNYGRNLLQYSSGALEPFAVVDSTINDLMYFDGHLYIGGDFSGVNSLGGDTINHITYIDLNAIFSISESQSPRFLLYPQPATGEVFISSDAGVPIRSVQLMDIGGKEIKAQYRTTSRGISLDVNELDSGMYVLQIWQNGKRLSRKLLVE